MQIDFHHGVIYVLARLAGFTKQKASTIAFCSQYVDDATRCTPVRFSNGAIYDPICSAHKMLDYRNFNTLANHLVWVPFHFLPGNNMLPAESEAKGDFITRTVCKPDSYIARDMVGECINNANNINGLHRLGITLHVYADTWAHQGFAGIQNDINKVQYFTDDSISENLIEKVSQYFKDRFNNSCSEFVDGISPLGHGAVLSYPDRPYLKWRYMDSGGKEIYRNNLAEYKDAVQKIYTVMKRFQSRNTDEQVEEINQQDLEQILILFETFKDSDGEVRHQKWLKKIKEGFFSFGAEDVEYSYLVEEDVFGEESEDNRYIYTNAFLKSDWKMFQDALRDHLYFLQRKLFPKYGLCLA
ncbi:hypothetical protein DCCM_4136 [Desulfocucumis palustris]|uniref:Uncharacterized protein n=1 Tax=Desulfocucumis palustris TaxID=1898651 RepID=A0A2L2XFL4_9FIRM|nr:DUF6765 family protein [Desulfocucumis palustris]GBF35015.1 hypothetical protein DCCM_4136 [Desulfocucumis palustris]